MRTGVIAHGALLGVALLGAWQTFTRGHDTKVTKAKVVVWGGVPADVTRVTYHVAGQPAGDIPAQPTRDVLIERRGEAKDHYLWATVTKSPAPIPSPLAVVPDAGPPDAGMDMAQSPLDTPPPPPKAKAVADETTKHEFPVGEDGDKLVANLAPLKAVRDLGQSDLGDRIQYGLGDDVTDGVTIEIAGATHRLIIGGHVYGNEDRYVLDPDTHHVYVIPGDTLRPLETADSSLRERRLHAFTGPEIDTASLSWAGKSRTLVRHGAPPPEKDKKKKPGADEPPTPAPQVTWADAATPDKPDQSLANFMDRFAQLVPTEFALDVDESSLTPVLTVDYKDKKGAPLGRLALYKREKTPEEIAAGNEDPTQGKFTWYVKTERTRVPAKVVAPVAERIEQDLANL